MLLPLEEVDRLVLVALAHQLEGHGDHAAGAGRLGSVQRQRHLRQGQIGCSLCALLRRVGNDYV